MTQALVLMKEQRDVTAEPMAVSEDIEKLMEIAIYQDFAVHMGPLREVGSFVPVEQGKAVLHLEETTIL